MEKQLYATLLHLITVPIEPHKRCFVASLENNAAGITKKSIIVQGKCIRSVAK
jgi:hypothetical protein